MATSTESVPLNVLYEQDETAWLEAMSALAAGRRFAEMDFQSLSEYLSDMAKRDRREVRSRLVVLMTHLLKWTHQPDRRTGSWKATLLEQRSELRDIVDSGTLYNHGVAVLADAYFDAVKRAAAETGLSREAFPAECPWDLDQLLTDEQE